MAARTGVSLLAAALLLTASPALASSPATLTSAGVDAQNRIAATWTKPATDTSDVVQWSTDPAVGSDPYGFGAPLQSVTGSKLVSPDATSATFGRNDFDDPFNPGTYHVQVVTEGINHLTGPLCVPPGTCKHYSNVMSVVVPEKPAPAPPPPDGSPPPDGAPPPDGGSGESAVVTTFRGPVTIQRAGGSKPEPVTKFAVLAPGDRLVTGPGGFASLTFPDGSRVDIGPNGTFEVASATEQGFSLTLDSLSLKSLFKTRFRVPRCRPCPGAIRGRREIRTSNAVAAVRGTDYTVETRKRFTRVRTRSGSVSLRNRRGRPRRTVIVKKGYESVVRGSRPPTKPRKA